MKNSSRIYPTGESHHNTKLTDEQVLGIIDLLKTTTLPMAHIAEMYGVGRGFVNNIRTGKRRLPLTKGLVVERPKE